MQDDKQKTLKMTLQGFLFLFLQWEGLTHRLVTDYLFIISHLVLNTTFINSLTKKQAAL